MSTQIDVTALRRAAVLYVVLVVTGIFGSFVPQSLVVSGDAVVTVHKLVASETLFRLTVVVNLVAAVSFVFLARELYRLLRAVDKSLASLMVTLVLASIPISFLGALTQVAAFKAHSRRPRARRVVVRRLALAGDAVHRMGRRCQQPEFGLLRPLAPALRRSHHQVWIHPASCRLPGAHRRGFIPGRQSELLARSFFFQSGEQCHDDRILG